MMSRIDTSYSNLQGERIGERLIYGRVQRDCVVPKQKHVEMGGNGNAHGRFTFQW
jgi:hypothetical protein